MRCEMWLVWSVWLVWYIMMRVMGGGKRKKCVFPSSDLRKRYLSDIRSTPLPANCIAPAVFIYLGLEVGGGGLEGLR